MPDKPPIWYKEDEIRVWLLKKGFYRIDMDAQITFITKHLQLAFEKGYSIAEREKEAK